MNFPKTMQVTLVSAILTAASLSASADDDLTRLSNDVSYLDGNIESRSHIYYPGDTIDIRVTLKGNTELLASQAIELYVGIFDSSGNVSFDPVTDYQTFNSRRMYFTENISNSVLTPGTYQLSLIATKPGGDPANVADWYNGFAGLLEQEALLFSETTVSGDSDGDGFWDNDYDRDGFYGDDDTVYEQYYASEGVNYQAPENREWSDDNWDDDNDDDWNINDSGNDSGNDNGNDTNDDNNDNDQTDRD